MNIGVYFKTLINGLWSNIPLCCAHYFSLRRARGEHSVALNVVLERGFQIYIKDEGFGFENNPADQQAIDKQKELEYVNCCRCFKNQKTPRKIKNNGLIFRI